MPIAESPMTVMLSVIVLSFVAAIISSKLKVSYPTVMITIGLVLSLLRFGGGFGGISFGSYLILGIVDPPLIFEAAMRTRFEVFRTVQKTVIGLGYSGL